VIHLGALCGADRLADILARVDKTGLLRPRPRPSLTTDWPAIAEVAPVIGARPLAEQCAVGLDVVIAGIEAGLLREPRSAG
jgi:hypothetical protein